MKWWPFKKAATSIKQAGRCAGPSSERTTFCYRIQSRAELALTARFAGPGRKGGA